MIMVSCDLVSTCTSQHAGSLYDAYQIWMTNFRSLCTTRSEPAKPRRWSSTVQQPTGTEALRHNLLYHQVYTLHFHVRGNMTRGAPPRHYSTGLRTPSKVTHIRLSQHLYKHALLTILITSISPVSTTGIEIIFTSYLH
ncbi:hypothetical protein BDN71DRAFT_673044 [Pleurotus eryngii]|uniref:Uncharacterized protein n=1 Tax=Pleurotus eryngii TaxID=5323 RepID=A0A9P6A094_PLEER|nr:hypothetical protein BDN71DRAFT_673044 [Pleurotus eryngii]